MPKPTKVTIDSISKEDVRDLFGNICDDFLIIPAYEAKEKYLKFKGSRNAINLQKVNITQLLEMCAKLGIRFEISVFYDKSVLSMDQMKKTAVEERIDLDNGTLLCDSFNKIEKQKEEITNPEFKEIIQASIPGKLVASNVENEEKIESKPATIPPFKI